MTTDAPVSVSHVSQLRHIVFRVINFFALLPDKFPVMSSWKELSWNDVDPEKVYKFSSGKTLRRDRLTEDVVYVRNGLIISKPENHEEVIDVDLGEDTILAPGFIEVQINGAFGIDFTSSLGEDSSGLRKIAAKLLRHGVTSFCPTIVTTTPSNYEKILANFEVFDGSDEGAACLGAHLEGPFISIHHKGAHDPKCITDFRLGLEDIEKVYGKNLKNVSIITLAPEEGNYASVIEYLRKKNIVVSIGHSDASYETALKAIDYGASMVTHLFNSMTTFHHRKPGIIGLLGRPRQLQKPLYFGILADNNHMHKATLRLAHNAQPQELILVSDGIAAMGLGDGKHLLGSQTVTISGTRAVIDGTDTLSGSVTPIDQCVRNYVEITGCPHGQALAAATHRPAQLLQLGSSKGNLTPGAQADFVVLDSELNVLSTWIKGRLVYKSR